MKSRALVRFVLILTLAAASSGCGGGSGDSNGGGNTTSGGTTTTSSTSTLTKQQFAAKITQICAKGKKKIAKIGFALGSAGSAANSGQEVADLESELIDKYKTLQPPGEIKSKVGDFITKSETARDKLALLAHAAMNFDSKNVDEVTPEVESARREAHQAATSFGATC